MPAAPAPAFAVRKLLAGLAVLALAGCSNNTGDFAPACPQLRLLPDGADLTRFGGRGQDLTDLVFQARLEGVPPSTGSCKWIDEAHTKVAVTMSVAISAQRGPAMPGRQTMVPYFIAVADGSHILDRQGYTTQVTFASNVERTALVSDPVKLVLPVSRDKSAAAYTVWVGLQLTPAELAYNRAHGK